MQTVISRDKLRNRWIDEGVIVIEDLFDVSEIKKVQIDFDLLGENMGTLSAFRIEAKLNSLVKVPKSWGGWGIKEITNA